MKCAYVRKSRPTHQKPTNPGHKINGSRALNQAGHDEVLKGSAGPLRGAINKEDKRHAAASEGAGRGAKTAGTFSKAEENRGDERELPITPADPHKPIQ
eukprot:444134-Amorphochlora_amoeboformis.AAC.1